MDVEESHMAVEIALHESTHRQSRSLMPTKQDPSRCGIGEK